jgi:hypothetical protein
MLIVYLLLYTYLTSIQAYYRYSIASDRVGGGYDIRYGSFLYFGILLYIDVIHARSLFGVLYMYD